MIFTCTEKFDYHGVLIIFFLSHLVVVIVSLILFFAWFSQIPCWRLLGMRGLLEMTIQGAVYASSYPTLSLI